MTDNQDANQLIIESVPLAGMPRRLIDPNQATLIRAKIAQALGMEDEDSGRQAGAFPTHGRCVARAHPP